MKSVLFLLLLFTNASYANAQSRPYNIAFAGSFLANTFAKRFLEEFYGYQFGSGSSLKTSGQVPVEENQSLGKFIPDQLHIYPNPASSELTIQVPEAIVGQKMEINFYDSVGKLVKTNKLTASKENSFSIRDLDEGPYLLQVVTPKGNFNIRALINQ